MYSLPHPPAFPVFGLGDDFDGFRWLTIWNDREHLYTVTLGHGHPQQEPWVSVTTVHKTPERRIDEDLAHGPTGFEDAWMDATFVLAEHAFPNDRAAAAAIARDMSPGDVKGPDDLGPEWEALTVTIDSTDCAAMQRRIGETWSYLADLEHVAVSVNGWGDRVASTRELVDQTGRLDRYQ